LIPDEGQRNRVAANYETYKKMVEAHQSKLYEQSLQKKLLEQKEKKEKKELKKTKVKKSTKTTSRRR
jgi:hypothetical protein